MIFLLGILKYNTSNYWKKNHGYSTHSSASNRAIILSFHTSFYLCVYCWEMYSSYIGMWPCFVPMACGRLAVMAVEIKSLHPMRIIAWGYEQQKLKYALPKSLWPNPWTVYSGCLTWNFRPAGSCYSMSVSLWLFLLFGFCCCCYVFVCVCVLCLEFKSATFDCLHIVSWI